MIENLIELVKRWKKTSIGIAFVTGLSAGGWFYWSNLCHAQTMKNEKTIEELVKIQQAAAVKAEVEAEQEKKLREQIRKWCILKQTTDKEACAEVGITLE